MALVIAHRGASAYEPENSLAAFRRALALGADGVEFDVHVTADHVLVVVHDRELDGRPVAELSLAEVRDHRLPNGERVPTLTETLSLITPDAVAFIELKSLPADFDGGFFACIDASPRPDRCHVHSFDHRIVRRLTAQRPGLPAGVLSGSYALDPGDQVRRAGATALWQSEDLIDPPLLAQVHEAGYRVYAWTVDRPSRMRELLAAGIDGLCSNKPDVAREVIG